MVAIFKEYIASLSEALAISVYWLFLPTILYVNYRICRYRSHSGKQQKITRLLMVIIIIISVLPILITIIISLLHNDFPGQLIDSMIVCTILFPVSVLSCGFVILPFVFLFLFVMAKIEKSNTKKMVVRFWMIEGVAIVLGAIMALLNL